MPLSEQGVVALFSKIDALGGVPFAEFQLKEITPNIGIDALADYAVEPNELLNPLAPLEFEFEFTNFERHRHSKDQVKLIVCWDLGTKNLPQYQLELIKECWLYKYSANGILVLVLSKIPGLSII